MSSTKSAGDVWVRRQWNDVASARYRYDDISGVHWSDVSGGINAFATRSFLHGYVMCDAMQEGTLSHSCRHGPPPHSIKVCIVKKDNAPRTFAKLVAQAGGPLPKERRAPTFWQWLKLKEQTARADMVGNFARELVSRKDHPGRNTFEAWKRRLKAAKGTHRYEVFERVWSEYAQAHGIEHP